MTFKKKDFAQIKAAMKKASGNDNSRPSNYYPFYRMDFEQKAIIRFLPDKNQDNELGFLVEKLTHNLNINGQEKTVPCLKMYGKECPICKQSAAFYKEGDEISGKKLYRRKQHIAQALVVEDPLSYTDDQTPALGTVKLINVGFTLFTKINDAFNDDDLDEIPWDYQGGTDFVIKRTKKGDYASYENSKFMRRPRALSDEEIAQAEENIIDLSTLLPSEPELSFVEGLLESHLTGAEPPERAPQRQSSNTDTSSDIDPQSTTSGVASYQANSSSEGDNSSSSSSDDFDSEGDDILAELARNRRAAQAE